MVTERSTAPLHGGFPPWRYTVRTRIVGVVLGAAMLLTAACGSTTMTSVGPTPERCDVAVTPPSGALPAGGGTGTISITTEAECTWSVSANASWISQVRPQNGLGSAQVQFTAAANAGPPRSATLTVDDKTVTVNQVSGCDYAINPTSHTAGIGGSTGSISVTTTDVCPWTAASNVPWVGITAGASGTGNGTVQFTVDANSSPGRTGTMTVAGETFTITQGSGCTYTVAMNSSGLVPAAGGALVASVGTAAGCGWTATAPDTWITVASGAKGAGNGQARFTVAQNAGPQRSGRVHVAGQTIVVTQASGCTYVVSPSQLTFDWTGVLPVSVTALPGCPWTVTIPPEFQHWVLILGSQSGAGSGTVDVAVVPFLGRRSAIIIVAGQQVHIQQN